jgi:hypothetical protein
MMDFLIFLMESVPHIMLLKGKRHNRMQFLILLLKVKKDFFEQKKLLIFLMHFRVHVLF